MQQGRGLLLQYPGRRSRSGPWWLTLAIIVVLVPGAGYADDAEKPPSPRVSVTIGAVSVVLSATPTMLYAFVDRLADNVPVEDAELRVKDADWSQVALAKQSQGVFVGPLNCIGQRQGTFTNSLHSALASGEATATIIYNDAVVAPVTNRSAKLVIAAVSMAISGIAAAGIFWWMKRSAADERSFARVVDARDKSRSVRGIAGVAAQGAAFVAV